MGILSRHKKTKIETEAYYKQIGQINCPYFSNCPVVFNSDGFHHLQFSAGVERSKSEQFLKFHYLKYVPQILAKAGTIQEYRKTMSPVGRKKGKDGAKEMKLTEFWGILAIISEGNKFIRVKVILKRIGDGNVQFWSVIRAHKKGEDSYLTLASSTIDEE